LGSITIFERSPRGTLISCGSSFTNKSSFLIRTENKPVALLEILKPFNEHNVNLYRIETRPSRSDRGSHDFFIDSEGHMSEQTMQELIKEVENKSNFVKVLGSYPIES